MKEPFTREETFAKADLLHGSILPHNQSMNKKMERNRQTDKERNAAFVRIAVYMRLSKTDETVREESNSISMQRILIRKYIAAHFTEYEVMEYQDDGFSGTNFNRPGVQCLLEDARNEWFDCVVVKDFSRFGRNYMEVGSYLEQIFPFLGIRFISINDHYDSGSSQGNTADLDVNFKNLLYDLYSKDLSQKVKTSLRARKESGQYVGANAPFGYEKSPDDRHMLVICEDEAAVVRKIFSLALQGMTSSQTAKKLNLEKVPTPVEFKIRKGTTFRKPKGDKFYWSSSTICSILRNPVYAGDMEYGKTEKDQVGGRNILKPRAEWKLIRNHHAPIIVREDFEEVQKSRGKSPKKRTAGNRHPLIGKVICGCCKRNLRIKEGLNPYFTCHNRYVTGLEECVRKVNVMFLEQAVLFRLEEYLTQQKFATEVSQKVKDNLVGKRDELLRDLRQAEWKYDRLKKQHYESYQLYSQGEQTEFHSLHIQMEKQQKVIGDLQGQVIQIEEQLGRTESEKFAPGEDALLTSEVMERYIDSIVVYNEEEIEIRWKM